MANKKGGPGRENRHGMVQVVAPNAHTAEPPIYSERQTDNLSDDHDLPDSKRSVPRMKS